MRHCLNKILYSKGGSGVLHGQKTTRPQGGDLFHIPGNRQAD